MNRRQPVTLSLLALAAAIACGTSHDENLFSGGSDPPSSGGTTATGGAAAADASTSGGMGGGSGGIAAGGNDTGGAAGAIDAAVMEAGAGGGPTLPPGAGKVTCGETPCDRSIGAFCCIPPPPPFQTAVPQCAVDETGCDAIWECDADNDCDGRKCCFTTSGGLAPIQGSACRESCEGGRAFGCSHPDDCEDGRTCCGRLAQGFPGIQAPYETVSCETACPDSSYVLCSSQSDCREGVVCQPSNALPAGYTACF